ncbi:SAM-dependent methyltransferase [Accumulibacter sp.]|uniref:SAM-dependent methyltransferase n=1 Tax=Accumulibacter sp. TaxID=2053492 RepID=UPI0026003696|nr:SAM-dependent methyltransferase [Accumulibacter sp.]MCM8596802.1 SAM-dependent methyltransferase [Accumulibacter sp.]MCM8624664.1 SAM-dependent methyltransferase [Accumulibacter sp.]MDS4050950.1 SAM-dependent methyltransferase [Accumulibacter sp.]
MSSAREAEPVRPPRGHLYLIPVPLGQTPPVSVLPDPVLACTRRLTHFVAENARTARAFIRSVGSTWPLQQILISELNEHTPASEVASLLEPALAGTDLGLVSESGCPGVADPGAALVALAHRLDVPVHPLIGPSSILLALMGSGLSGQNFAFHGYLPTATADRERRLQVLEKESRILRRTQIFIETPYRNAHLLASLIRVCAPGTLICVATDLTLDSQQISTHAVAEWRRRLLPAIDRRPSVFLLQA